MPPSNQSLRRTCSLLAGICLGGVLEAVVLGQTRAALCLLIVGQVIAYVRSLAHEATTDPIVERIEAKAGEAE